MLFELKHFTHNTNVVATQYQLSSFGWFEGGLSFDKRILTSLEIEANKKSPDIRSRLFLWFLIKT